MRLVLFLALCLALSGSFSLALVNDDQQLKPPTNNNDNNNGNGEVEAEDVTTAPLMSLEKNGETTTTAAAATESTPAPVSLLETLDGVPTTFESLQPWFVSLGLSAKTKAAAKFRHEGATVKIKKDTRMQLSISRHRIVISSRPAITAKKSYLGGWVSTPTASISSVRFGFGEAKFEASAEGVGFDSWYSNAVAGAANEFALPILPEPLKQPGFNPATSPELIPMITEMRTAFMDSMKTGPQRTHIKLPFKPSDVVEPSARITFETQAPLKIPLAEAGVEADIPAGKLFSFEAIGEGDVTDAKIRMLRLDFGRGIHFKSTSDSTFRDLMGLVLKGITIRSGGIIKLDYDLEVEDFASGLVALGQLFLVAASVRSGRGVPNGGLTARDVRLNTIREEIDQKVQETMGPQLHKFVDEYDQILPGFSLKRILNMDSESASKSASLMGDDGGMFIGGADPDTGVLGDTAVGRRPFLPANDVDHRQVNRQVNRQVGVGGTEQQKRGGGLGGGATGSSQERTRLEQTGENAERQV